MTRPASVMNRPPEPPSPGREAARRFAWWIPRDLTATWFVLAILYFTGPPVLPEPMVALAVGTTVGLAAGLCKAVMMKDGAGTAIPDEADRGRLSETGPDPSQRGLPHLPGESISFDPARTSTAVPRQPAVTRPTASRAVRAPRPLDFGRYRCVDPLETQCPRCGSFNVARGVHDPSAHCRTCGNSWRVNDPESQPDVVVRSWLCRSDPTQQ